MDLLRFPVSSSAGKVLNTSTMVPNNILCLVGQNLVNFYNCNWLKKIRVWPSLGFNCMTEFIF